MNQIDTTRRDLDNESGSQDNSYQSVDINLRLLEQQDNQSPTAHFTLLTP